MRVALITERAYPYHTGGVSNWCQQLVTGMPDHTFEVVALTYASPTPSTAYARPGNVAGLYPAPVWDPPARTQGQLARRRVRRAAGGAAALMCRGMFGDTRHHETMFAEALLRLSRLAAAGAYPLAGAPLADVLIEAWRAGHPTGRLSRGDAKAAAVLLEHAVRPLAASRPDADLYHPTGSGLAILVALAAKWLSGTPYLLTEHGIYLRERYLDYGGQLPESVRVVMLRFFRALCRLGYAEATTVVAGSRFNQRWALQHGADPARIVVVPGGVAPVAFPVRPEPVDPVVVWVGRIEPLKDLHTLINGFWRVRQELPRARLRLVGPVADPGYEADCRELIQRLGLVDAVELTGTVPDPAAAYASGQVVARTSVCEGVPYPLIEAMMCGRATVSTEVGGVAEVVGDTGLLVPPGDPAAVATALTVLLRDPARRCALGMAAARRARGWYPVDLMLRAYRRLYADAVAPAAASQRRAA